jgi:hypothetical protein
MMEMTAKIKRMWMRKLLTWKMKKPPAHSTTRMSANSKNIAAAYLKQIFGTD